MIATRCPRRSRLETVRRRLDRWRQTRGDARAPLPPHLWAAWLIEIEGVRATVRVRLNALTRTDLADFTRLVVGAGA